MYNPYYGFRRGSRFGLGGGFFVPFVLGGIAGSLWNNNNRPNTFYYPYSTFYSYPYYY